MRMRDSAMADDSGESAELLYRETSGVCCRRAGSRICHSLLAIVFFLVMVMSFTSLGIFTAKHNAIADDVSGCILYTSTSQLSHNTPSLSRSEGCGFTIWGSGILALGCGLFMLGFLIKIATGTSL